MPVKICRKCNRELPATIKYFFKDKKMIDGLFSSCKECCGHKFTIQKNNTPNNGYRICTKCEKEKPETLEFFGILNSTSDKFTSVCKDCRRKLFTSTDNYKKKCKEYREKHKEEKKPYFINYRLENRDKIRDYHRSRYEKNKSSINKRNNEYREINKAKVRQSNRDYYFLRGGKENQKKYYLENIDNHRIINNRREHRIKKLPCTLTLRQWENCKKYFKNQCAYCGELADVLHQEHLIPVSSGGPYVAENIIPSCRSCNSSKYNKDFFDWYPKQEFYSKKREQKILQYLSDMKSEISSANSKSGVCQEV